MFSGCPVKLRYSSSWYNNEKERNWFSANLPGGLAALQIWHKTRTRISLQSGHERDYCVARTTRFGAYSWYAEQCRVPVYDLQHCPEITHQVRHLVHVLETSFAPQTLRCASCIRSIRFGTRRKRLTAQNDLQPASAAAAVRRPLESTDRSSDGACKLTESVPDSNAVAL